jgi:hypothetical protein
MTLSYEELRRKKVLPAGPPGSTRATASPPRATASPPRATIHEAALRAALVVGMVGTGHLGQEFGEVEVHLSGSGDWDGWDIWDICFERFKLR